MRYLLPILLLSLTLGMDNPNCGGGDPGNGMCGTRVDVTVQVKDICDASTPVILDQFSVTYPDGEQIDIRSAILDPPGIYRVPRMVLCEGHQLSAVASGYESYVDSAATPFQTFIAATMTPIGGCPIP